QEARLHGVSGGMLQFAAHVDGSPQHRVEGQAEGRCRGAPARGAEEVSRPGWRTVGAIMASTDYSAGASDGLGTICRLTMSWPRRYGRPKVASDMRRALSMKRATQIAVSCMTAWMLAATANASTTL